MTSLGPYELHEELGRGAMGVVFRGFDPGIGRPVAIKVMHAVRLGNDAERAEMKLRFAREAAAAGKLSHPNIVVIYQLGGDDDVQYLVLELVNGTSLEKILSNGRPLEPQAASSILSQVADALDYAHTEGIVHRDVKPANILVRPEGMVKLTDFGIARIASQTITQTGLTLGTPAYMSPEQILSARVTSKADQYSLGVVAYEMLGGKKPFEADDAHALMYRIMSSEPPQLHTVNPLLSPAVSEAISRALSKKPEDRYPTCKEFVETLARAQMAPTIQFNRAQDAQPVNRKLRLTLWLTGAGLCVLGLFAARSALQPQRVMEIKLPYAPHYAGVLRLLDAPAPSLVQGPKNDRQKTVATNRPSVPENPRKTADPGVVAKKEGVDPPPVTPLKTAHLERHENILFEIPAGWKRMPVEPDNSVTLLPTETRMASSERPPVIRIFPRLAFGGDLTERMEMDLQARGKRYLSPQVRLDPKTGRKLVFIEAEYTAGYRMLEVGTVAGQSIQLFAYIAKSSIYQQFLDDFDFFVRNLAFDDAR